MTLELRLFVYGTLKRGFPNHDSYCAGMLRAHAAWVRGRLFTLGEFPAMTPPREDILACGTADILSDIETQERFEASLKNIEIPAPESSGIGAGWGEIEGELLVFDDPQTRLPLLDSLEEFYPGGQSTYIRALVPVTLSGGLKTTAWIYIAGFNTDGLEEYAGKSRGRCS
jgi:gamma-glutamylcyclotransferase (GGCT)/AIG2-like uncharacterized protein YtfP